jgi:hypothetical protein
VAYSDPNKAKEVSKLWYKNNKERSRAATKRYRAAHPDRVKAAHKKRSKTQRFKDIKRESRQRLKVEVLTHYSPNGVLGCCWSGCLIADVDMLTLDHINDDGNKQREAFGQDSSYRQAKKRDFPSDLQTLCMNHQIKKKLEKLRQSWQKETL